MVPLFVPHSNRFQRPEDRDTALFNIQRIIEGEGTSDETALFYVMAYTSWVLDVPMPKDYCSKQEDADNYLNKALDLLEQAGSDL